MSVKEIYLMQLEEIHLKMQELAKAADDLRQKINMHDELPVHLFSMIRNWDKTL